MSDINFDVVIAGGGISGLTAGIELAESGAKVAVISRGDPAVCLSTGCIDLFALGNDPLSGIKSLPPEHPYNLLPHSLIEESLEIFSDIMFDAGLPYIGNARKNRNILTPIGNSKITCLVPRTMETAPQDESLYVHVIGFKGLKDFYPSYITSRRPNTGFSIYDAGVESTMSISARFDDFSFVEDFIKWLRSLEIPDGRIALPAVLGLAEPLRAIELITASTERLVFEIPTLPPSIPGMRLFKILKKAMQAKGGEIFWGLPVASVEKQGKLIEAVTIETPARPTRLSAKAFILASGSFVSGGLYAGMKDNVMETVFDLPVFVPGARDSWFSNDFFRPGHEIEKAGIVVDGSFRPFDFPYENLFVCGSILAHSEVMKNGCGHGLGLATGLGAARSCKRYLS
jgi:glycerol-3-phosphate dehydrogenase subunit B